MYVVLVIDFDDGDPKYITDYTKVLFFLYEFHFVTNSNFTLVDTISMFKMVESKSDRKICINNKSSFGKSITIVYTCR